VSVDIRNSRLGLGAPAPAPTQAGAAIGEGSRDKWRQRRAGRSQGLDSSAQGGGASLNVEASQRRARDDRTMRHDGANKAMRHEGAGKRSGCARVKSTGVDDLRGGSKKRNLSPSLRSFDDLSARLKSRGVDVLGGGVGGGTRGKLLDESEDEGAEVAPWKRMGRRRGEDVRSKQGRDETSSSGSDRIWDFDLRGRRGKKATASKASGEQHNMGNKMTALQFVLQQITNFGGMMALHKLGTLLNQKHPEMKRKVGKLRSFLAKHPSFLRVISSHDVNGSPEDFVMLTDSSASKVGRSRTLRGAQDRGKGRKAGQASVRKSKKKGSRRSTLERLNGRSARGDPCNLFWGDSVSGESEAQVFGARARAESRKGAGRQRTSGSAEFWRQNRRGLSRALSMDDGYGISSDSDLPIGTL
jgi:hypothetical protein